MVGVRVGGGGGGTDIMRGPFLQDFLFQTQNTVYTPVYSAFIRRRDVAGNASLAGILAWRGTVEMMTADDLLFRHSCN